MNYRTALVIDDDPLFRLVAEEMLMAAGVPSVRTAEDGRAGLAAFAENSRDIDLVLCDLQMPDMDGVDVVRELARLKFCGTLIIASSVDKNLIRAVHDMAQILGIQIAGALQKPLDPKALQALLQPGNTSVASAQTALTREEIERAIAERTLCPHFQPQVDLLTGRLSGFEVLARVKQANGNFRSAAGYLLAAEQFGLMMEFTLMIIDQVTSVLPKLRDEIGPFKIALNLSPTSIQDLALPGLLASRFLSAGVESSMITLEVTEDRLLERKADILEVLARLRLAGFRLSVDDFGAGTTSIEQLKFFPFTELKIDQQFIQSAAHDEFSRVTVESSIALARMRDMTVVAEGVDTIEALNFARAAGAHEAQGFYFSPALPASDIPAWLSKFHQNLDRAGSVRATEIEGVISEA